MVYTLYKFTVASVKAATALRGLTPIRPSHSRLQCQLFTHQPTARRIKTMRSTPLYAPDGMMTAGRDTDRFVGTAASERDDDGLVHNHTWATSENANNPAATPGGMFPTIAFSRRPQMARFHHQAPAQTHDRHDDGLVHNHQWAVTGR
jgi:hypothetical protein